MLVTKQLPVAADFEIMKNKIDDDDRIRIFGWTIPSRLVNMELFLNQEQDDQIFPLLLTCTAYTVFSLICIQILWAVTNFYLGYCWFLFFSLKQLQHACEGKSGVAAGASAQYLHSDGQLRMWVRDGRGCRPFQAPDTHAEVNAGNVQWWRDHKRTDGGQKGGIL